MKRLLEVKMSVENKRREILLSKSTIDERIAGLGLTLTEAYKDKNLLVISL